MLDDPNNCAMCTLNQLRKATRAVAKINDAALAPLNLKSTQFSLLVTLQKCGDIPLSELANVLVMERTTLTRNIKPLMAKGLITSKTERDKRLRIICITQPGKQLLLEAEPLWRVAQLSLVKQLGSERWSNTMHDLDFLTQQAQYL